MREKRMKQNERAILFSIEGGYMNSNSLLMTFYVVHEFKTCTVYALEYA